MAYGASHLRTWWWWWCSTFTRPFGNYNLFTLKILNVSFAWDAKSTHKVCKSVRRMRQVQSKVLTDLTARSLEKLTRLDPFVKIVCSLPALFACGFCVCVPVMWINYACVCLIFLGCRLFLCVFCCCNILQIVAIIIIRNDRWPEESNFVNVHHHTKWNAINNMFIQYVCIYIHHCDIFKCRVKI